MLEKFTKGVAKEKPGLRIGRRLPRRDLQVSPPHALYLCREAFEFCQSLQIPCAAFVGGGGHEAVDPQGR